MIHPDAIREFLTRKRDDHRWMKTLRRVDLDRELARLGFKAAAPEPLLKHQKVCVLLGIAHQAFPFWLDMGTGKTRVALELLRYWAQQGQLKTALILTPSESALIGWENQIALWKIDLPFLTLLNSPSQDKRDAMASMEHGLILATYPGIARAVSKLSKAPGQKKQRLSPDPKEIGRLAGKLQGMVADESTKLGNHDSLTYKVVKQLRKSTPIFYELAGRPFGRDPTMLWSQLYLIDQGETLGETLGMFRGAFFTTKINYWGGYEHIFRKTMKRELHRILQHRSIAYRWDECIDLPKLVATLEEVTLPAEAEAYYREFVKQIKRTKASFQERKNAFTRMRQVSSGFVGFNDDETGERAEISFAVNPKLDRLLELVEQVPHDCKFVIGYEFTHSGRLISESLTRMKIKHEWLWGGSKDPRGMQDRFDHDEGTRGMVMNWRKGAFALNLQRANYLMIYESPVPVIEREQLERRVRRQGQERKVFQADLVCRGTMDARILAFHAEGADLLAALLRNPNEVLGINDNLNE